MADQKYCIHCMNKIAAEESICPWCGLSENLYTAQPHHLMPFIILNGKYLIGKVLGEGGFGITYIARDLNLDMRVAVKEYYPFGCVNRTQSSSGTVIVSGVITGEEFAEGKNKLMEEARTLAKLSCLRSVVGVRDFFRCNNTAYIVMDYLEGTTLKDILKVKGTMSIDQVLALLMPIMDNLAVIHETGLIHRDISPDNIMVLKDGSAQLLDFGAARQTGRNDAKSLSIVLKPGYTPEEQYRSKGDQGPWTDIYALAATIYRALTGRIPDEALQRIVEDELKRPSACGVQIGIGQEEALMKGLAIFSRDRYQNIVEFKNALLKELDKEHAVIEKPEQQILKKKITTQKKITALAISGMIVFGASAVGIIGWLQIQKPVPAVNSTGAKETAVDPEEKTEVIMESSTSVSEKETVAAEESTQEHTESEEEILHFIDAQDEWHDIVVDEKIPKHDYDFSLLENTGQDVRYLGDERYAVRKGVDVSYYQGTIDWECVKNSGIEFAFIRVGSRGYGESGTLRVDANFNENIVNACQAGLEVGVYLFSQAINEEEAVEEAQLVISQLQGAGIVLTLPVVYEPELIRDAPARTDYVTGEQLTRNAVAFCEKIKEAGYEPMIYCDMEWEAFYFDLNQLTDYQIWYADYGNIPQTPYWFSFWQYSCNGQVDGILGRVDLNVQFVKNKY